MITVIDCDLGNIKSILNMIKKVGGDAIATRDHQVIARASRLILPGVGSFDYGMGQLKKYDLIGILNQKVIQEKTPVLGICLGMQLLTNGSQEGQEKGLGWLDTDVKKFNFENDERNLKTPHMGWRELNIKDQQGKIMDGFNEDPRFYFVHSYYVKETKQDVKTISTNYGHEFVALMEKDNILGVQFHPEKSHRYGMIFFKNYIERY